MEPRLPFHSRAPGTRGARATNASPSAPGKPSTSTPESSPALSRPTPPGTRLEFNFISPTRMEMAIGDETVGPSNNQPQSHRRQVRDQGRGGPTGKANAAWWSTSCVGKQELLDGGYLVGDMGRLTRLDADFHAYMVPGGVVGQTPTPADRKADTEAFTGDTNQMTITIHE
ncbi:hypothetical protein MMC07_007635 [Pseudocyphellaria aurata]|nr:hypothetical protein [Pseudocyphellaria aurata]